MAKREFSGLKDANEEELREELNHISEHLSHMETNLEVDYTKKVDGAETAERARQAGCLANQDIVWEELAVLKMKHDEDISELKHELAVVKNKARSSLAEQSRKQQQQLQASLSELGTPRANVSSKLEPMTPGTKIARQSSIQSSIFEHDNEQDRLYFSLEMVHQADFDRAIAAEKVRQETCEGLEDDFELRLAKLKESHEKELGLLSDSLYAEQRRQRDRLKNRLALRKKKRRVSTIGEAASEASGERSEPQEGWGGVLGVEGGGEVETEVGDGFVLAHRRRDGFVLAHHRRCYTGPPVLPLNPSPPAAVLTPIPSSLQGELEDSKASNSEIDKAMKLLDAEYEEDESRLLKVTGEDIHQRIKALRDHYNEQEKKIEDYSGRMAQIKIEHERNFNDLKKNLDVDQRRQRELLKQRLAAERAKKESEANGTSEASQKLLKKEEEEAMTDFEYDCDRKLEKLANDAKRKENADISFLRGEIKASDEFFLSLHSSIDKIRKEHSEGISFLESEMELKNARARRSLQNKLDRAK